MDVQSLNESMNTSMMDQHLPFLDLPLLISDTSARVPAPALDTERVIPNWLRLRFGRALDNFTPALALEGSREFAFGMDVFWPNSGPALLRFRDSSTVYVVPETGYYLDLLQNHFSFFSILPRELQDALAQPLFVADPDDRPRGVNWSPCVVIYQYYWATSWRYLALLLPGGNSFCLLVSPGFEIMRPHVRRLPTFPDIIDTWRIPRLLEIMILTLADMQTPAVDEGFVSETEEDE